MELYQTRKNECYNKSDRFKEAYHKYYEGVENFEGSYSPYLKMNDAIQCFYTSASITKGNSLYTLGNYVLNGHFLEKDIEEAISIYKESAMHECILAAEKIAQLYTKDMVSKKDMIKIVTLYEEICDGRKNRYINKAKKQLGL